MTDALTCSKSLMLILLYYTVKGLHVLWWNFLALSALQNSRLSNGLLLFNWDPVFNSPLIAATNSSELVKLM